MILLILKFADDTKVFGRVSNSAQRQMLQDDLDKLCAWADSWQMEFNVDKCKAMHIGRLDWIGVCSVLRPLQHSIGYIGDVAYRKPE